MISIILADSGSSSNSWKFILTINAATVIIGQNNESSSLTAQFTMYHVKNIRTKNTINVEASEGILKFCIIHSLNVDRNVSGCNFEINVLL